MSEIPGNVYFRQECSKNAAREIIARPAILISQRRIPRIVCFIHYSLYGELLNTVLSSDGLSSYLLLSKLFPRCTVLKHILAQLDDSRYGGPLSSSEHNLSKYCDKEHPLSAYFLQTEGELDDCVLTTATQCEYRIYILLKVCPCTN